jgi:hypothetical protein
VEASISTHPLPLVFTTALALDVAKLFTLFALLIMESFLPEKSMEIPSTTP